MIQEMWPDGNMSHPVFPEIVVIDIGYHLIKRVSLIDPDTCCEEHRFSLCLKEELLIID